MTGYEYEEKCARLLEAKGFSNVVVTPGSGDQGIDVLADKGKEKYGVQCKYYEGTVGNKAVQEAYSGAKFYDCDVALVITNSTLTRPAKELAKKLGVTVWENINAIYLQEHDAEFVQKEQARKKREKEKAEKKEREQMSQHVDLTHTGKGLYGTNGVKSDADLILLEQNGRKELECKGRKAPNQLVRMRPAVRICLAAPRKPLRSSDLSGFSFAPKRRAKMRRNPPKSGTKTTS